MSHPVVSRDPLVQGAYVAMREAGESHSLSEMLALASPPMSNTDREFLQGHANGSQFERTPEMGDFYREEAEKRGQDVKGKVYLSGLAAYPGDPRAWVSGRGDVQRVCEDRGWSCRGSVNVRGQQAPPSEGPYRVAQDIVEDRALDLMEADPSLKQQDALETARGQLSPSWKGS